MLQQQFESCMLGGAIGDAGQIAGTLFGKENFPTDLIAKLETVANYNWVSGIIETTKEYID